MRESRPDDQSGRHLLGGGAPFFAALHSSGKKEPNGSERVGHG